MGGQGLHQGEEGGQARQQSRVLVTRAGAGKVRQWSCQFINR